MPTVILSSKIYNNSQLELVKGYLKSSLKGLNVKVENVQATTRGWIQVTFSGEDEKAVLSYLEKKVGLCPIHVDNMPKFLTIKGYVTNLYESEDKLYLDVGVTSPKIIDATIPLQYLQAQLADGRKLALKKIAELFSFTENMPIITKITGIKRKYIEAAIAENQLRLYRRWTKSLLDRLIVLGASQQEIKTALKNVRCQNDVITVEQLGLFEHAIACKLGTEAVGLIPKIGKKLPNTTLATFKPKMLLEFFKDLYIA